MRSLSVGDTAPNFTLPSVLNGSFSLSSEVEKGPVLLYFYVVNYGKTCTDYIAMMNERKEEFDSCGVRMVHINPDSVENHRGWMDRVETPFDHLSDQDQKVSKEYGSIVVRAKTDKLMGYTNREFFLVGEDMKIRYIWKAYWPTDIIPIPELLADLKAAVS